MAKKNYIPRELEKNLMSAAKEFAAVAILGPRQSGKTTLARHKFPKHKYISLEDYDLRELANTDPRGFLNDYPSGTGIILDEIQHAPKLLSYITICIVYYSTFLEGDYPRRRLSYATLRYYTTLYYYLT